jgi:carbonic anhydrase
MAHGKFGTAINCMDGRAQLPVTDWVKQQFNLDYVDMITEPGPDKIVSGQGPQVESIKARATISANAHGSKIIVVAGHDDCAGNPVSEKQHKSQIKDSIKVICTWNLPFDKVIGLWVNKDWKIEVVDSSEK